MTWLRSNAPQPVCWFSFYDLAPLAICLLISSQTINRSAAPCRTTHHWNGTQPMPTLTLGTASQATGCAKSTILRAIKSGRISATRAETGEWSIDPAELFRVFPALAIPGATPQSAQTERDATPAERDATTDALVAELRVTIAQLRRDCDYWRSSLDQERTAHSETRAAHAATQAAHATTQASLERLLLPPPAT